VSATTTPARRLPFEARIFLVFAFSYFFAALLRGVTATLAPAFSADLGLGAADLGLLAGAFFFGFAAMQLPLGGALDRHGPRRVLVALLAVAVLGCALFALASSLAALVAARALIGVGVGASLMAALTSYRRHFSVPAQLRANSWMLMTGSLGMLASTLPVQALLPLWGWRGLFWAVGAMLAVGAALVAWLVPPDRALAPHGSPASASYGAIVRHPLFFRLAPLAFFGYGGMIAVQSLWAGPWLTRVAGRSPAAAAEGLFAINLAMLLAFLSWGALMPRLARRGVGVPRLITWGVPVALLLLAANVAAGADAGALHWAAWCVASSVMSLSQPAVGMAFPPAQAGRALSAFNLVIFGGVFCLQWGIGLAIDALGRLGLSEPAAFRAAFAGFWVLCVLAYAAFLLAPRFRADNAR
jgi:predicted MFS family arabinose efflux permease